MTHEQRIARGNKYATLRAELDPLFDGVRTHLLEMIESASPNDPEAILEMHRGLQNLFKVKEAVKLVIVDGQMAEAAIRMAQLHRS